MTHATHLNLDEIITEQRAKAQQSRDGRSAVTLFGGSGKQLGQVLVTFTAGSSLPDHPNPGEAILQVLDGEVTLSWGDGETRLGARDYQVIPDGTHRLDAHVDSVVLLTVHRSA